MVPAVGFPSGQVVSLSRRGTAFVPDATSTTMGSKRLQCGLWPVSADESHCSQAWQQLSASPGDRPVTIPLQSCRLIILPTACQSSPQIPFRVLPLQSTSLRQLTMNREVPRCRNEQRGDEYRLCGTAPAISSRRRADGGFFPTGPIVLPIPTEPVVTSSVRMRSDPSMSHAGSSGGACGCVPRWRSGFF